VSEPRNGSKRSLLAQERSRDTRQAIIKAALELWSERGYASGIDDTTAEEIAARAGVAKATFYLHFARKDDILLETGWVTTKVFYEDVLKALPESRSPDEVIDDVTVRLCRRIEKVPRLAMQRILRAQANAFGPRQGQDDGEHFGFQRGFALIIVQGQQAGEMPHTVTPASLGGMFEAMLYESLREWAYDDQADLLAMLRERFAVLLAGARSVTASAITGRASLSAERYRRRSVIPAGAAGVLLCRRRVASAGRPRPRCPRGR
jgi:AcrR family transcriptional regulator